MKAKKTSLEVKMLIKNYMKALNLACRANVAHMSYKDFDYEYQPLEDVLKRYFPKKETKSV